ncbi:cellulase family glycosylhydrolase [Niastella sp. MAH-29]|uniref:Cellulase family glycosylhydrolase n=2 Tax=Chitinophagaceae TaxID=563835 RepID=A0ABS3YUC5_9BACT|nr:cellulase family glycosylhydrolase [Niastella soli]
MKPLMKPILLFVSLFLCVWGFGQTPVASNGQLKVVGTKLVNQNGYPVQLRGMSTHGLQWYSNCITDASLDVLKNDWGADIMRISMYIQEDGYETNPTYFTNLVKTIVNKLTARGMYALIDFHMLEPSDPNYNLSRAITFFTDIANTFKNNNNVLYEICNEPSNVSWSTIKNYANQVIPVIRAIDNDAPIIVGTRAWSSLGMSDGSTAQEIINSPLNFPNLLYTFHFYAKDHRDSYLNQLSWAADRLPIFVTEFGSQEASGDGPNDFTMAQKYIDLMRTKKISWCNWNYSDDFRSGAVWKTGTCGGTNWTTSRLKEAGTWVRNNILTPADDFGGGPIDTTGPTNPNPTNIALNKTVTVSSVEDNTLTGNLAVDGNGSTRWASAAGIDPQSITVDLGGKYNISRIKLVWEAAYGKNFVLEVSPDNSTWTNVKNITGNTSLTNDYTGLSTTGRYVRMTGTARGTEYGYSLYEFEVYGTAANDTTPPPPTTSVLIQAESYSSMSGVQTETTTDTDGGQDVGWIDQGDWMAFSNINFPVTGTYKVEYRVASLSGGGRVSCDLNAGSIQLGQVDVPNTGGWQTWTTISHNVTVTAGTYNFGVYAQASGWNLNWIRITPVTTTTKSSTRMEAVATAANSLEQRIQVYPVPSKDEVTITLPESTQKTQIVVTDLNGKTYYTGIASGNVHQLHISKYPAGIYVVQLLNGNNRIVKRIVKK